MSPTATQNPTMQSHIQGIQFTAAILETSLGSGVSPEQSVFTMGSSKSNIAWLLGHLTFSVDAMLGSALGLKPELSPEEMERYKGGVEPSTNIADYPSVEALHSSFKTALAKRIAHLETLDDDILGQPLPEGHPAAARFPSIDVMLNAIVFHTGYHTGQISLLRRAQGLESGFGA